MENAYNLKIIMDLLDVSPGEYCQGVILSRGVLTGGYSRKGY